MYELITWHRLYVPIFVLFLRGSPIFEFQKASVGLTVILAEWATGETSPRSWRVCVCVCVGWHFCPHTNQFLPVILPPAPNLQPLILHYLPRLLSFLRLISRNFKTLPCFCSPCLFIPPPIFFSPSLHIKFNYNSQLPRWPRRAVAL